MACPMAICHSDSDSASACGVQSSRLGAIGRPRAPKTTIIETRQKKELKVRMGGILERAPDVPGVAVLTILTRFNCS
jgi:hypothetical protein